MFKTGTAVAVMLAAVAVVQGDDGIILCGRQLADARVLLCYGSEYIDKRNTVPMHSLTSRIKADEDRWPEDTSPWTGRRGALSMRWSRHKRIMSGLVDECCLKPCTTDEIMSYC